MAASRNEERLAALQEPNEPAYEAPQPSGGFSYTTPTEFVELPSKGAFYPEGHPLHMVEEVEIKFMTAKEEDILTSSSLIKKGLVLDRLLKSVLIDKRINTADMLIGDRNALIMATRKTGYGPEYETNVTCPSCGTVGEYSFDLDELKTRQVDAETLESFNIQATQNGTFLVRLPKTGVQAEFRLLTGKDENYLSKQRELAEKKGLPDSNLTNQLRMMIVSVNGSTERADVNNFVVAMPAYDAKFLRGAYSKVNPDVELKHLYSCDTCGHAQEMEVPLNADFFWPR
jgi:hypothetical protein